MRTSDELAQSRRRSQGLRDAQAAVYRAPTSAVASDFYVVVDGDGDFPTTGLNTVFAVQLTGSGSETFAATNLGESIPISGQTIVRCDQVDGQLFFTYRGNGVAT